MRNMALYGITDRSQILGIDAVVSACNMINTAAADFEEAAKKLEEAKLEIDGEALKIEGKTMEGNYDTVRDGLRNVKTNIEAYTAQIVNEANAISYAQQQEYLDYLESQKQYN